MPIPQAAWFALSAMAPSMLSAFMPHESPHRLRSKALSYLDPSNLERDADQMFQQTLSSPGYNMARSDIIGAGQSGISALNRHLGQTGIGRSGVGASMAAAAGAAPGIHLGKLTASAWDAAMQQALGMNRARAATVMGMPGNPSPTMPLAAAGMSAYLPYLFKLLQSQHGNSDWVPADVRDTYGQMRGGGWF